jgi:hypothetical protein
MIKEIRKQEVCKSCLETKTRAIYEVFCDNCGTLIETGPTYGSKLSYTVWNNSIEDFDASHKEKNFCSYECLFNKMRNEQLKNKRISLSLHIDKDERKKLLDALTK